MNYCKIEGFKRRLAFFDIRLSEMGGGTAFWKYFTIFLFALFVQLAFGYFVNGDFSAIPHDNLDSEVVYNEIIGRFYSTGLNSSVFNVFLGGSTKSYYYARLFQPLIIVYSIFNVKFAYILTDIIVKIVAYVSLFRLARSLKCSDGSAWLISCFFAFSISYTVYGVGIAAFPYLVSLTLTREKLSKWQIFLVILAGLNTMFIIHGLFLPILIFAIFLILKEPSTAKNKVWIVIALSLFGSLLASAGLIYVQFSGLVSQRAAWNLLDLLGSQSNFTKDFFISALTLREFYHGVVTPALYSVPLLVVAAIWGRERSRKVSVIILAVIFIYAISMESWVILFLQKINIIFTTIQWNRFYVFLGALFSILLLCLEREIRVKKILLVVNLIICCELVFTIFVALPNLSTAYVDFYNASHASGHNSGQLNLSSDGESHHVAAPKIRDVLPFFEYLLKRPPGRLSFDGYYDSDDYAGIKKIVGNERTISVGCDPMVAAFNGINVVDGYHNLYPLAYKNKFFDVIKDQIDGTPNQSYFDDWGSRVYTFVDNPKEIKVNFDAAKKIGAKYVISRYKISDDKLKIVCLQCNFNKNLFLYKIE